MQKQTTTRNGSFNWWDFEEKYFVLSHKWKILLEVLSLQGNQNSSVEKCSWQDTLWEKVARLYEPCVCTESIFV